MGTKIKAKAILSGLRKGGKPCYQLVAQLKNKVGDEEFLNRAAAKTGESLARARLWADAFSMTARECLLEARPFVLTNLMRGSLVIGGSVTAVNAALNAKDNPIKPTLSPIGTLKSLADAFSGENVTLGIGSILYSVDQLGKGAVLSSTSAVVYVNGAKILTAAGEEGTGVWLEDSTGTVVAIAEILRSDENTIDCRFPELPEDGSYRLVIATRNGLGEEYGVERLQRNVKVSKAA